MKVYMLNIFVVIFAFTEALSYKSKLHPLSDEFIELVNSKTSTWKAGRNFHERTPLRVLRNLMGVLPRSTSLRRPILSLPQIPEDFVFPVEFDPRNVWSNCSSLSEIRNQGCCGSCWAVSSASVMTDRECIHSNGQKNFHYSSEDLISCCKDCGSCDGGSPLEAFRHWVKVGIVSGGSYNSSLGCYPYEIPNSPKTKCKTYSHTPKCHQQCEPNYKIPYIKDLRKGYSSFAVKDEKPIMYELVRGGPVVSTFLVYEDFLSYKSGVYSYTHGEPLGLHAIRILGYGVENGIPYWLCANSWGSSWGDEGRFKILKGHHEQGIEDEGFGGTPL